jgi:hypothetical protein
MLQLPYELWKIILEIKYENFKKRLILFKPVQNIYICGGKGTGKTTLVKDLLFHKNSSFGLIVGNKEDYKDKDYDNISDADFSILVDRNKRKIHKFCVIDTNTNRMELSKLRAIYFNARHYSLLNISCHESFLAFPPYFRVNIDCFCIFNGLSIKDKNKIYDEIGLNVSKQEFNKILDNIPLYNCLVININTSRDMFYFKAQIRF